MPRKTNTPPPSLSEILKQGDNAAIVQRLDKTQKAAEEAAPKPKTLEQMAGGFQYYGQDYVTGIKFYGREPKVGQLGKIIAMANGPQLGEEIDGSARLQVTIDHFAELAALFLFVPNGELWRPATLEEVKGAFDLGELLEVKGRFSGLKASEGNA